MVIGLFFLISDQTKPGFISLIVHALCSWLFCQNLSLLWMLLNFVKYLKTVQKCTLTLISFKRKVGGVLEGEAEATGQELGDSESRLFKP